MKETLTEEQIVEILKLCSKKELNLLPAINNLDGTTGKISFHSDVYLSPEDLHKLASLIESKGDVIL
jgi:hypothetical protein